ncbi:hypothetical protein [Fibrella arboris]|uniref:hypothetical protein n=1 Tax=Fibrella arboris TaxID=3242486 RepID=UPI003521CCDA
MSTVETLHRVVDNLPEEAQIDLIRYIAVKYDDFLPPLTDEEKEDTDALINKLLTERYTSYKKNPETAIPADESRRRTKDKYGWK